MSRRVSLFLIPILHQTTTLKRLLCGLLSCSSFQFYIKPQPITASSLFIPVVPHSNSTSNHNFHLQFRGKLFVVPHSNSTSNHNVLRRFRSFLLVVPHSNSTSNHNMVARLWKLTALFLIPILHQTTTAAGWATIASWLFLIPILHQTTTNVCLCHWLFLLFLIPILHQTTTWIVSCRNAVNVVPHSNSTSNHNTRRYRKTTMRVVPHSNSTSNHNASLKLYEEQMLFLIPILHQTTTSLFRRFKIVELFLIPILHQTTTACFFMKSRSSLFLIPILHQTTTSRMAVIHILHVTHMTPMHKTSCRTPGKLVGCNFVFQRAIYQKNSSC